MLEPTADGFRNYYRKGQRWSPAQLLVDRANLLTLTVPEMACLLYTSDAADERSSVDLGGRRIIKKKKTNKKNGGAQEKDAKEYKDNVHSTNRRPIR